MGTAATSGEPARRRPQDLPYEELVELARLFLSDPENKAVEEQLLGGCAAMIRRIVEAYVSQKRLPNIVIDDAVSLAQMNMAFAIRDLRSPDNLKRWLVRLTRNAAVTEFLKIIGRAEEERTTVPVETEDAEGHTVQTLDLEENRERARPYVVKPFPDPDEYLREREREEIFDKVIEKHIRESKGSKRDRDSGLWIKTRIQEGLSVEEIAKARGTSKDDVWHIFEHDTPILNGIYRKLVGTGHG